MVCRLPSPCRFTLTRRSGRPPTSLQRRCFVHQPALAADRYRRVRVLILYRILYSGIEAAARDLYANISGSIPNIPVRGNRYGDWSSVHYNYDEDPDCWWSATNCVTPKLPGLKNDTVACDEANTWGYTLDDGKSTWSLHGESYLLRGADASSGPIRRSQLQPCEAVISRHREAYRMKADFSSLLLTILRYNRTLSTTTFSLSTKRPPSFVRRASGWPFLSRNRLTMVSSSRHRLERRGLASGSAARPTRWS